MEEWKNSSVMSLVSYPLQVAEHVCGKIIVFMGFYMWQEYREGFMPNIKT